MGVMPMDTFPVHLSASGSIPSRPVRPTLSLAIPHCPPCQYRVASVGAQQGGLGQISAGTREEAVWQAEQRGLRFLQPLSVVSGGKVKG